jgi:hypothetical protein
MIVYFINWCTPDDWDCYVDEHGNCETIEHLANPVGLPYVKIEDAMADAMNEHTSSIAEDPGRAAHEVVSWRPGISGIMYGLNASGGTELVMVVRTYKLTAGAVEIVAV